MQVSLVDLKKKYVRNKASIDAAISRILENGQFILGSEGEAFEKEFAKYIGTAYCVGVNSGTDALYLALRTLGVSGGDEVLTTAHTATPTVSAIRMARATPVFVDTDPRTFNIDVSKIEKKITSKTKVILPVHLYGYPAEMLEIKRLAEKHDVKVLEDAAQACGALYKGMRVGTFGNVAAFSFYPTKNLGAFGDGGAIVTNDETIYKTACRLRNYGEESKYRNVIEGVNSRLDEIQAAILRIFLADIDQDNAKKVELAKIYKEKLEDVPIILPNFGDDSHTPAWHLFVIRTDLRDALKASLSERGIQTAIHYPRLPYQQEAYAFLGQSDKNYPNASVLPSTILSIPLHGEMNDDEVKHVANSIREFYSRKHT